MKHARRHTVFVVVGALAAFVSVPAISGPAAGGSRLVPAGVSVTYPTGILRATGVVVPITVKVSGASSKSTCGLAYNSSNPSPVFVGISPLRPVKCRDGRARFSVTLGSNLVPVVSTVPLQFSLNVSPILSEVHDLSLQVAAGPAHGPPVPPTGEDYLGAFVNAAGQGKAEPPQAEALDTSIGRPQGIGILHWFVAFGYSPAKVTAGISQLVKRPLRAVPLLDWSPATSCAASPSKDAKCVSWLKGVASGADDRTVKGMAEALKVFGKPMFLRFFWEMNLHLLGGEGQYFVEAWDHIVEQFSKEDVANVEFVWSPGLSTNLEGFSSFYPGANEVDWIGIDAFDHESYGSAGFRTLLAPWYAQWDDQGRPLMISETAARMGGVKVGAQNCRPGTGVGRPGDEQADYIHSIGAALNPTSPAAPRYPGIKAFIYWDSSGAQGPYCFDKGGLKAFKTLAKEPFFSFMSPHQ